MAGALSTDRDSGANDVAADRLCADAFSAWSSHAPDVLCNQPASCTDTVLAGVPQPRCLTHPSSLGLLKPLGSSVRLQPCTCRGPGGSPSTAASVWRKHVAATWASEWIKFSENAGTLLVKQLPTRTLGHVGNSSSWALSPSQRNCTATARKTED